VRADIHLDFETRSVLDLRDTGVHRYVEDPHTGIWCAAWALAGEETPRVWSPELPELSDPIDELFELVSEGHPLRAWNAQFERVVWAAIMVPRYGAPRVPREGWYCTMAEAAAMALPSKLEQAAQVLRVAEKDMEGHRLMMRMARPRKRDPLTWWSDPDRILRLMRYCQQDVVVEGQIKELLARLSPRERAIYLLDQQINDRGVLVDTDLVRRLQVVVGRASVSADLRLARATNGAAPAVTNVGLLKAWVQSQGVEAESLAKPQLQALLDDPETPEHVRAALLIRQEAGKSSTAKLAKMLTAVGTDNVARGMLVYHKASTGRWAGSGIQPQNLVRPRWRVTDQDLEYIAGGDLVGIEAIYGPVLDAIASCLRGCLRSRPGMVFFGADYNAIEARVLAWIAGQADLVEMFRSGAKVYEEMASLIYPEVPFGSIGKDSIERFVGKETVLGCGYQMGGPKFAKGCQDKGIEMSEERAAEIVSTYRGRFPRIPALWYATEKAVVSAVRDPGRVYAVAGIPVEIKAVVRHGYLWLQLPSGRVLSYSRPRLVETTTPWGSTRDQVMFWGMNSQTRQWTRQYLYGGKIVENIVQATARDLMAEAMLRIDAHGVYLPVLTVHDEILTEGPEDGSVTKMEEMMAELPGWARGCPVKVEGWRGGRYQK